MNDREALHLTLAGHYQDCESKGYKPIYLALYGSQNYDLATPESDVDSKAIVLPTLDDIVYSRAPVSTTVTHSDGSLTDVKDIRLMFDCFKKQNVNFIEILFTDYWLGDPTYDTEILSMRSHAEEIAHYNNYAALNCMKGMALEKFKALCHPYPTIKWKIDKWGYDGKQLSHILRMYDFLVRFAQGESYKKCLIAKPLSRNNQLAAKRQEYNLENAQFVAQRTVEHCSEFLKEYMETTPVCVNESTNNFLMDLTANILRKKFKSELE